MKLHHLLIFAVILFSQLSQSQAAYVEKVKGKKTLIFLDGMSVNKGDMVDVIDPTSKKKTAILRITTVKDNKAIGQLVRGKAKVNHEVVAKGQKASSAAAMPTTRQKQPSKKRSSTPASNSTFAVGGLFGVGMDTMEIIISGVSVEKTGMGMSLLGAGDMKLADWFTFRGLVGIEQFNAKGDASTNVCTSSTNCETEIMYFTAMGWGKFHFTESFWLGVGLGLQHPLSKKTNALDESTIKTSALYGMGGGFDINLSENMYIPLQLEYGIQPKSDQVSTSYFAGRIGLMLRY